MMSAGLASILEVGLDNGKMTGRLTRALIASTTSLVNAPCVVDVPIRMVGCTFSTTVCRPMMPDSACAEDDDSLVSPPGAGDLHRAVQPGHGAHAGALHVVVEDPVLVPVGDQDPPGVIRAEVLEVQQRVREPRRRRLQVLLDERVVGGDPDACAPG